MKFKRTLLAAVGAAVLAAPVLVSKAQADQFFPLLVYRTGPYAVGGIPLANGFTDYFKLLNARDGGVNGVKLSYEECETKYNTKIGVECYEKMKNKGEVGPSLINPYSTGITYQLIPKAPVDKVPIHSMGYGRTAAGDGRVFPWAFTFPTSYWSQAAAFINYVGELEGGMDKLKGKKLVLVYHNSAYGKEPIPTFNLLAKKYGYEIKMLAVDHPGQEQKAAWLQIRRYRPDYVFLTGWGVMNQVAIKEAAAINFPMDHFIGNWWSAGETDVRPAGKAAIGYKAATFNQPGAKAGVHADIIKHVYGGDAAAAKKAQIGEVLYNRGVMNAIYNTESVRTAMGKYGNKAMSGEQVRWGMENLDLTQARLNELGVGKFMAPTKVSCADHEGGGKVMFQQWTGTEWKLISGWIGTMQDVIRPMTEAAAAAYAKENKITLRSC
ncbi:MAG: ABC transporter substrate-binding protein [Alphaproteobacteria bacterium]|jgi:branched-chain amino acid transport system substrate-binding protein|nr:ABC transporter permease [Rhodospirillaceae bacterium]MDP6406413.1 ABC transporter substrate-binding protein [Alphaproteobacteria bacterium]|tara:strand:- start:455 stop:1765 length:1311 start_codon:yes stop_codon:yes gene_type:complete